MQPDLARNDLIGSMEAAGIKMGEITFIKDGLATTIHDNGDMTVIKAQQCDECKKWDTALGGFSYRDVGGEIVIWLCAQCRA